MFLIQFSLSDANKTEEVQDLEDEQRHDQAAKVDTRIAVMKSFQCKYGPTLV